MINSDNLDSDGRCGPRPFIELTDTATGLLWLINRTVFHPRGFALVLVQDNETKEIIGWEMIGSGEACFIFSEDVDDVGFEMVTKYFTELTEASNGTDASSRGSTEPTV